MLKIVFRSVVYFKQMCFFDFRFIFVTNLSTRLILLNNFASGAADIGDQLVFRCSRPVFKLSGEIKFD